MSGFSKEQVSNVKALLESVRREGCFDLLLTAMRDESHFSDAESSEFELLSPRAKRRGDAFPSDELPMSKQRPLLPKDAMSKDAEKSTSFPPGIHSVEEWGTTVTRWQSLASEEWRCAAALSRDGAETDKGGAGNESNLGLHPVGRMSRDTGQHSKPCIFHNSLLGCEKGHACDFCHDVHPNAGVMKKRPRKQTRESLKICGPAERWVCDGTILDLGN
eukprot:s2448_g10.t1